MTMKLDFADMLARVQSGASRSVKRPEWRCDLCREPIPEGVARCDSCAAAVIVRGTAQTIPARYADVRFDAAELTARVKPPKAIGAARAAVGKPAVVLLGNSGTGKSTLGAAMLVEWAERMGKRGLFIDCESIARGRLEWGLGDGEAPIVERAMRAPVLFLDELGADDAKGTAESAIRDVVHRRYDRMLPTIIGTWLTFDGVRDRYGISVARRVYEGATVVRLGGQS